MNERKQKTDFTSYRRRFYTNHRCPLGTCSGQSFPAQEVQAEARSPLPGDAEDIYKGRGLHQAISLEC